MNWKRYLVAWGILVGTTVISTYVSMFAETRFYIRLEPPPVWIGVIFLLVSLVIATISYVKVYNMGIHGRDMETGEHISIYPRYLFPTLWLLLTLGFVAMPSFLGIINPKLDLSTFAFYTVELYYALFTVAIIAGEYVLITTVNAILQLVLRRKLSSE